MLHFNGEGQLAEIGGHMRIIDNGHYLKIIKRLLNAFPDWNKLRGKTLLITGASGMIGSLFVDSIMLHNQNETEEHRSKVIAVVRNYPSARERFALWLNEPCFFLIGHDITQPLEQLPCQPDYFIHGASTSHPIAYSTEPINTILANVLGTQNILNLAAAHQASRFLLLSSVEIYGENRGDTDYFTEEYCGYLNCNTLRAGYPEAKRVSEALCQAFIAEKSTNAVIIRFPRCYGPTMGPRDSKAVAQFIQRGIQGRNIILKSDGMQLYSFAHVADAVLGILYAMLRGEKGQAYNLGDTKSDIYQKDLAKLIADYVGTEVVFDVPGKLEQRGYSTATRAVMNGEKLRRLGWSAQYDISNGIHETIDILRELNQSTRDGGM